MSTQNPNWPLIDEAIAILSGPNDPAPAPYWLSITGRTEGRWTSQRGRQYELDQVQTGTATSTLRNDDGLFDGGNTQSPFYPMITPYRAYRRRAQLPATVNVLTADQATAGHASGLAAGVLPRWVANVPGNWAAGGVVLSTDGAGNYVSTVSASSPNLTSLIALTGWSSPNHDTFTVSCTAKASTTGLSVQLIHMWQLPDGDFVSLGGPTVALTAANQRLTASFTTDPDDVGGAVLLVVSGTSPGSTVTVTHSQWQLEYASTASTYVQPGTWYDVFTGFVERWPQSWTDGGTYGVANLSAIDAFGYLSQRKILSPAYMEALALGPNFLYPLDEQSGTVFYDLTANNQPAGVASYPVNAGTAVQAGQQLSGSNVPQGIPGPVVGFTNNPASAASIQVVDLGQRGVAGPPQSGSWTRVFAFQLGAALPALGESYLWFAYSPPYLSPSGSQAAVEVDVYTDGSVNWSTQPNGYNGIIAPAGTVAVGAWHLVGISINPSAGQVTTWFDGNSPTVNTISGFASPPFTGVGWDVLGGDNANTVFRGFDGSMAFAAEFGFVLTTAQWQRLWSVFRYGGSGSGTATSATRYADVLTWAQWAGQSAIDNYTTGECVTYGPSTDLLASAAEPGTDGVSALQTVVDTDDGEHFADRSGVVTFHARRHRFNQTTPKVTFGEAAGEIPYVDCSFGLDSSRLVNDAAITQTASQTTTRMTDGTSIGIYGDVQLQRTVNDTTQLGLNDMATYLAYHYATPVQRIETLTVSPATYTVNGAPSTAAWQALLGLELGDPVAVNRRPPNAPTLSFTGFVERVEWSMDDAGSVTCQLQISPNYGKQFWQLDSATFSILDSSTRLAY